MDFAKDDQKFYTEAARVSSSVVRYPLDSAEGPNGEPLTTTAVSIGEDDAKTSIVISSGIHGVENHYWSKWMRTWLTEAAALCQNNKNLRFVLAHGLNPFGAAYSLRSDAENIDPNRNFVDFRNLPSTSENYKALAASFSPTDLNAPTLAWSWGKLLKFGLITHSIADFEQALCEGQYDFADGLYYGGREPSQTRKTWDAIVTEHVLPSAPESIWHIDLHTSVGPRGKMQLLVNAEPGGPVTQRVEAVNFPHPVRATSSALATLSGDITDYWPSFDLPKECIVTPFAVEIGTVSTPLEILHAMMLRNTLFVRYNDRHPKAEKIVKKMERVFAPEDNKWRTSADREATALWKAFIRHVAPG